MSDDLEEILSDEKTYKGVALKGPSPSMAYQNRVIDAFLSAIDSRFEDVDSNPVVKATRVACLATWPSELEQGKLP